MDMNGVLNVIDVRKYRVAINESIRKNERKISGLSVEVKEILPEYVKIAWKKNGKKGSFKMRVVETDVGVVVDGFPSRGEREMWFVTPNKWYGCSDTVEGAIDGLIGEFIA